MTDSLTAIASEMAWHDGSSVSAFIVRGWADRIAALRDEPVAKVVIRGDGRHEVLILEPEAFADNAPHRVYLHPDPHRGLNTDRRMAAVELLLNHGWRWIDGRWDEPRPSPRDAGAVDDKGPWYVGVDGKDVLSNDFTVDAALRLSGDFRDDEHRREYAEWLCRALNEATP